MELPYKDLMKTVKQISGRLGMTVIRDYDLRASLAMKCEEADPDVRWSAYVNRKGTLCHVVAPAAELIVRLTFPGIQHMNTYQMHQLITQRCGDYVKL